MITCKDESLFDLDKDDYYILHYILLFCILLYYIMLYYIILYIVQLETNNNW